MKIYVHIKNSGLPDKLMRLYGDVEVIDAYVEDEINGLLKPGELLFMDRMPPRSFIDSSARVLVVLSGYSQQEEFLAARAGAKGFIASDISEAELLRVVQCVAAGEIWMTRKTIARVFEEYVRLLAGSVHSYP